MAVLEHASGPGAALRVLADPTRLRVLALLERGELSVGELARALGMAQSRVSNHLRVLREAGTLAERHAGTSTYLRPSPELLGGDVLLARLWRELRAELEALPEHGADVARLASVLAERGAAEGFFDRLAGAWDERAGSFESGRARERAAARLLPAEMVVADLGSGPGATSAALLGSVAKIVCVDSSPRMLEEAGRRLGRAPGATEIELRRGSLEELPIADGEVDGVVAGLVLHHLASPDRALSEMRRVLKPGGTAVALELAPHREAWMHAEHGDRHLGLDPSDLVLAFRRAGFEDVALDPVDDHYLPRRPAGEDGELAERAPRLPVYIVRARRPRVRARTSPRAAR